MGDNLTEVDDNNKKLYPEAVAEGTRPPVLPPPNPPLLSTPPYAITREGQFETVPTSQHQTSWKKIGTLRIGL